MTRGATTATRAISGGRKRIIPTSVSSSLRFRPAACLGGAGAPDGVHITLAPSQTGAF